MTSSATNELTYNTVSLVMEGWEELKKVPDYESLAGVKVLQRLFILCPESKVLFGLDPTDDPLDKTLLTNAEFLVKAQNIISMFDVILNMLGPDIDLLTQVLQDVVKRHEQFGVTKVMFEQMEYCLISTMEEVLGTSIFNSSRRLAFQQTYRALLTDMQRFDLT